MKKWSIPCRINPEQKEQIQWLLVNFTGISIQNGYYALFETVQEAPSDDGYLNATITLFMDDEYIEEKHGAKRGPKLKQTNITVEEMARMKESGMPPKEIAERAGIGIATYFRRMAEYKNTVLTRDVQ